MTKTMDRMTLDQALSDFPSAVKKVQRAAEESLAAARGSRVQARRERISMQSQSKLPAVKVSGESNKKLEMPEDWRDDEDTRKIKTG